MTVKELIENLSKFPQEMEVFTDYNGKGPTQTFCICEIHEEGGGYYKDFYEDFDTLKYPALNGKFVCIETNHHPKRNKK